MTRAQFDDLRRRIQEEAPGRARGVVMLLASVEIPEPTNHRSRRAAKLRPQHRHPANSTARKRRRQWHDPDPREAQVRELNRLARKHLRASRDEDGEIAGLLAAVAEFAVPHLLNDFELDAGEHSYPFQHWLMAKFGDTLRQPDVEGYLRWREEALAQITSSSS